MEVDQRQFDAPLGGNAQLKCFVVGNMGGILAQWMRPDGRQLPRGSYERGGILYLRDLKRDDSGQYACEGVDQRTGQTVFQAVTQLTVSGMTDLTKSTGLTPRCSPVGGEDGGYHGAHGWRGRCLPSLKRGRL